MNYLNGKNIKRFLLINFGLLIMSVGLHIFIIPMNLASGGVTGLGLVIKAYFPELNMGLLMLAFNFILFIMAFIFIGKEFGGYTIYASFALSGMIGVMESFFPISAPVTDDIMLSLLFGTLTPAIGMAIVFYQNASTGGTDIVAKIINKYTNLEIGKALFLSDALVTVAAAITFNFEIGMYAFLGILLNGTLIDKVIAGFETKVHAQVISEKINEISGYIHNDIGRGVTLLTATGAYTGQGKQVIVTVLSPREYIRLRQHVRAVDPKAFIIMSYVHEVLGEGFDY
ncbi:MAG: YitT family protein [Bacillota bacterium]|nr:YitT family protein [Bacillota bacterium]